MGKITEQEWREIDSGGKKFICRKCGRVCKDNQWENRLLDSSDSKRKSKLCSPCWSKHIRIRAGIMAGVIYGLIGLLVFGFAFIKLLR